MPYSLESNKKLRMQKFRNSIYRGDSYIIHKPSTSSNILFFGCSQNGGDVFGIGTNMDPGEIQTI
jgi:hypothetical protein